MIKKIAMLMLCISLTACGTLAVTGDKMSMLSPGDGVSKVTSIVGNPDGFERLQGGEMVYRYINRHVSGWEFKMTDYYLLFKNGELISVTTGPIRDNSQQFTNSLNALNQNLENQRQRDHEARMRLSESIDRSRAQKVIICKQGDFLCY